MLQFIKCEDSTLSKTFSTFLEPSNEAGQQEKNCMTLKRHNRETFARKSSANASVSQVWRGHAEQHLLNFSRILKRSWAAGKKCMTLKRHKRETFARKSSANASVSQVWRGHAEQHLLNFSRILKRSWAAGKKCMTLKRHKRETFARKSSRLVCYTTASQWTCVKRFG